MTNWALQKFPKLKFLGHSQPFWAEIGAGLELRGARGLTQEMLAEMLHVQQPAVAKIERRADMYISTLRSHIKAMGGELEITAKFPDGAVKITNFSQIEAVN